MTLRAHEGLVCSKSSDEAELGAVHVVVRPAAELHGCRARDAVYRLATAHAEDRSVCGARERRRPGQERLG